MADKDGETVPLRLEPCLALRKCPKVLRLSNGSRGSDQRWVGEARDKGREREEGGAWSDGQAAWQMDRQGGWRQRREVEALAAKDATMWT